MLYGESFTKQTEIIFHISLENVTKHNVIFLILFLDPAIIAPIASTAAVLHQVVPSTMTQPTLLPGLTLANEQKTHHFCCSIDIRSVKNLDIHHAAFIFVR